MRGGDSIRQKTIAENMRKGGKAMLKMFKKKMPMPVNLNDCVLLWQMGFRVEVNDGRYITVAKEGGKNDKNIA